MRNTCAGEEICLRTGAVHKYKRFDVLAYARGNFMVPRAGSASSVPRNRAGVRSVNHLRNVPNRRRGRKKPP